MLRKVRAINHTKYVSSQDIPKPGFVKLIDTMPSIVTDTEMLLDVAIVQAARVSYGEGSKGAKKDRALIDYLMKHQHTSPFEMVEFKWHCKMPIFVQRQWIRHRTANINEISGRYTEFNENAAGVDEFHHPNILRKQSKSNKQGSDPNSNLYHNCGRTRYLWNDSRDHINRIYSNYHELVELGVAREQARSILPVSGYTEFYWKIDLHNLLKFIQLRTHSTAQLEIQLYAREMLSIVEKLCPATIASWKKHVLKEDVDDDNDPPPPTSSDKIVVYEREAYQNALENQHREFGKLIGGWSGIQHHNPQGIHLVA